MYVTRYPVGGERWPVSSNGGTNPHWSRDGKELFFLGATSLMRASVTMSANTVEIGAAETLFDTPFQLQFTLGMSNLFSVSPDGQRFLFAVPTDATPTPLTLLLNWPAALRR